MGTNIYIIFDICKHFHIFVKIFFNMKRKKDGRKKNGGKRKGAGRKFGKPTTVIAFRVPIEDKAAIKEAINTLMNN